MKKMIMALTMIVTLATSAFANDEKIKPAVLKAFTSKFTHAQDITWNASNNLYKAAFLDHGMRVVAYYNTSAELVGLTRNISSTQLPYHLQSSLQKHLTDFWITDLFELSNDEGFAYYITFENADKKIVLESKNGSGWEVYQTNKSF